MSFRVGSSKEGAAFRNEILVQLIKVGYLKISFDEVPQFLLITSSVRQSINSPQSINLLQVTSTNEIVKYLYSTAHDGLITKRSRFPETSSFGR